LPDPPAPATNHFLAICYHFAAAPLFLSTINPLIKNKNINIRNTTTMAANGTTETTSLVHKSKEDEENFAKLKAYQP
jgi:hypothetical protein